MTFHAKITSKGQITLPVELRSHLGLGEGDVVEFYFDHAGRVCVRPRHSSTAPFLEALQPRPPATQFRTDDDAIADAVLSRDDRSRRRKRTKAG